MQTLREFVRILSTIVLLDSETENNNNVFIVGKNEEECKILIK